MKYLGYIFTSENSDDAEMLRRMRLLYCRWNRLIRILRHFIVFIFGLNTKKLHFLSFELRTIMYIVRYLVSSDEAVPAKCLC